MRLFLGIFVPKPLQDYIQSIGKQIQDASPHRVRSVAPDQLHITVAFLGTVTTPVDDIIRTLEDVPFSPFTVRLAKLELVLQHHHRAVLWIAVVSEDLLNLCRHIISLLGIKEQQAIRPHITIARIHTFGDPTDLDQFVKSIPLQPLTFTVTQFELIASQQRQNGSHYISLKRFLADAKYINS